MSQLIGSVSLTNREDGLYLGKVNVENLPDTLTSNSLYVNDGENTIQSKVDVATQADCIYISSGSYGENVQIHDKLNIALIGPQTGNTICEITGGLSLTGTSEMIRLVSLQIEGNDNTIKGVGRHYLYKCVFQGFSTQTNFITIKDCTKYITFEGCEFDQYCNITINHSFASVCYFINCNFGGATLNFNQTSPLQVILNNCAGFVSLPANATQVGLNVLANGISNFQTTNINGTPYSQDFMKNTNTLNQTAYLIPFRSFDDNQNNFTTDTDFNYNDQDKTLMVQKIEGVQMINNVSYPPPSSGVTVANQVDNRIITATATNNSLNAEANLTFDGSRLGMNNLTNYVVGTSTINNGAFTKCVTLGSGTVGNGSVCVGATSNIGNASVLVGSDSGRSGMSGAYNTIIGYFAGRNLTSGGGNIIVGGNGAANLTTGSNNVLIGGDTGNTHSNNTVVGSSSNTSDGTTHYTNCTVLGSGITGVISGNSQVQLGNSTTTTYAYGTVQTRSDARDKADIKDTELGLNFIEKLKPRDFRFDYRDDYKEVVTNPETLETTIFYLDKDGSKKRNRYHHGLIAQEVKAVMDELNIDFGGYQDHKVNDGADRLTIGYDELISPMIRAIQQLNEKVKNLELQIKNN